MCCGRWHVHSTDAAVGDLVGSGRRNTRRQVHARQTVGRTMCQALLHPGLRAQRLRPALQGPPAGALSVVFHSHQGRRRSQSVTFKSKPVCV